MKSRSATIIGVLVLAICLVCPLVELLDCWDHTPQTGNDTEYTFVIVGLCVGALYTFARVVLKKSESWRSNTVAAIDGGIPVFSWDSFDLVNALIPASPPPVSLRI